MLKIKMAVLQNHEINSENYCFVREAIRVGMENTSTVRSSALPSE